MPKVYIVTEGEYASYRILAVFLNREEAEKYLAKQKQTWLHPALQAIKAGGDERIEEWEVTESGGGKQ